MLQALAIRLLSYSVYFAIAPVVGTEFLARRLVYVDTHQGRLRFYLKQLLGK